MTQDNLEDVKGEKARLEDDLRRLASMLTKSIEQQQLVIFRLLGLFRNEVLSTCDYSYKKIQFCFQFIQLLFVSSNVFTFVTSTIFVV